MKTYIRKTEMPVSVEELFSWHENNSAFERLTPSWDRIQLIRKDPTLEVGSETHLKVRKGPFSINWIARHTIYNPPQEFSDIQLKGPFADWQHHHRMHSINRTSSELEDSVNFRLPLGIGEGLALRQIDQMFQYRHAILFNDLCVQKALPLAPMTVAITCSRGVVGKALSAFLRTAGHRVISIEERISNDDEDIIEWDPAREKINSKKLEGVDAVIDLSQSSGIKGVRTLVEALNSLKKPPQVMISASSTEFYGQNAVKPCNESSSAGNDFFALACRDWEEQAKRFTKGRCVIPRFGIVLSATGGVLEKMRLLFFMGMGGIVGSGEQVLSWISLDDLVYAIYRLLAKKEISGPVNCCSPHFVTNRELIKTLGRVLCRPTIFPALSLVSRIAFGRKINGALLLNCKAPPAVLQGEGHDFYYRDLEDALRHTMGRRKSHEPI